MTDTDQRTTPQIAEEQTQAGPLRFGLLGALSGISGAALGGLAVAAAPVSLALLAGLFTGSLAAEELMTLPLLLPLGLLLGAIIGGLPAAVAGVVLGVWLRDNVIGRNQWVIIGCGGLAVTAVVTAFFASDGSGVEPGLVLALMPVGLVATLASAVVYRFLVDRFVRG